MTFARVPKRAIPPAFVFLGPEAMPRIDPGMGGPAVQDVDRMTIHIVKLCVGAESIDDLAEFQKRQIKKRKRPVCGTRMWPKRVDDVLAGGSLYWVIKGVILVRQRIVEIAEVRDDHGLRCGLWLDPEIVRTCPQPRRAFQGWRYLDPKDAPTDLSQAQGGVDLPEHLRRQLVALGAW